MTTTDYSLINTLEETQFFANSDFTFYYTFKQADGVNAFDLTGAVVTLVLCLFGQPETTVLQKAATITTAANGECNVALLPADTLNFSGRYTQQPVIVKGGKTYRPGQGQVFISPAITVSGG
jgi:hypothetical protein